MLRRGLSVLMLAALLVAACAEAPPKLTPTIVPPPSAASISSPTVTPTVTPIPLPTPTNEARWVRIGPVPSDPNDWMSDVVGFKDQYVFAGSRIEVSKDGVTWNESRLPLRSGRILHISDLATDGQHLLAVGSYTPCTTAAYNAWPFGKCRQRPASWITSDTRTWRSSGTWTGPFGDNGQNGSIFNKTWSVPTGGWDAAQTFDLSDESDDGSVVGPTLWHSEDGVTWSLLHRPVQPPDSEGMCEPYWAAGGFWASADAEGRRVAYEPSGCDGRSYLSTSQDGRQYYFLTAFSGTETYVSTGLSPSGSGPWLFGGSADRSATIWTSSDLSAWTTITMPITTPGGTYEGGYRLVALAHSDVGYVAVGAGGSYEGTTGLTWVSDDGIDWRLVGIGPEISAMASGKAGLLGLTATEIDTDTSSTFEHDVWKLVDHP